MQEKTCFVRCASHRARERLARMLGYKPPEFYKLTFGGRGEFGIGSIHVYQIPESKLEAARKIPGVTRSRDQDTGPDGFSRCH